MRSHWWSNSGALMSFIYMKIFKNREVIDNTITMSIYCLTKLQNITQCVAQENKRTNLVLIELMGVSHDPTRTTDDLWLDLFFSIEFCFLDLDLNFSNMVEIYICLCIYFMKKNHGNLLCERQNWGPTESRHKITGIMSTLSEARVSVNLETCCMPCPNVY
jgi:hypothetical protein